MTGSQESGDKGTVLAVGNDRSQISVARSLGRAGHRVIIGRGIDTCYAELSRHASEVWDHPPVESEPAAFMEAILAFLGARPDIRYLYPIGDLELMQVSRHRDRLPDRVTPVVAAADIIELCHDKVRQLELARDAGVTIAPFTLVSDMDALREACDQVGWPCVIKPSNPLAQLFNRKALILGSREELQREMPAWPKEHEALLVQHRITGPRHNLYFAAQDGEPLGVVEMKILRNQMADGTGLAVEGVSLTPTPLLLRDLRALLKAMNITGAGCAQFLYGGSEASTTYLETNPRLGANFASVLHCGLDLPRIAVALASGERLPVPERLPDYPVGERFAWSFGDLFGLKKAYQSKEIGTAQAARWLAGSLWSALRADTHITWSWSDPKPALAMLARPLVKRLGLQPKRYPKASTV